jgi:two-component system response regulator AlgR
LFQFDTTAFLSKPITGDDVKSVLLRISSHLRDPRKVFMYRFHDEMTRISLAGILYFESNGHKIEIVTREDRGEPLVRTFYGKLDEVEAQLKHPGFLRIHQSLLVNLDNVERFSKSTLFLPGGRIVTMAQNRQREIRSKIMDYYTGTSRGGKK